MAVLVRTMTLDEYNDGETEAYGCELAQELFDPNLNSNRRKEIERLLAQDSILNAKVSDACAALKLNEIDEDQFEEGFKEWIQKEILKTPNHSNSDG